MEPGDETSGRQTWLDHHHLVLLLVNQGFKAAFCSVSDRSGSYFIYDLIHGMDRVHVFALCLQLCM